MRSTWISSAAQGPKVRRLPAGGRRIRNSSTAPNQQRLASSEMSLIGRRRCDQRAAISASVRLSGKKCGSAAWAARRTAPPRLATASRSPIGLAAARASTLGVQEVASRLAVFFFAFQFPRAWSSRSRRPLRKDRQRYARRSKGSAGVARQRMTQLSRTAATVAPPYSQRETVRIPSANL